MHVLNRAQLTRGVVALWPITLVCAVLGALVGALSQTGDTTQSAEAMVRLEQPASVSAVISGQPTSTDDLQSYVSGEIAYLSGSGFRDSVKAKLGTATNPTISAVQNSNSAVVTISSSSPTESEAQRTVDTAISTYLDHTSQQLRDRNTAALNSINALITQQQNAGRTAGIPELRTQASALQLQMAAGAPASVVQPATETEGKASNWSVMSIIGGVVGAILGLGSALIWRNRKRFITSASDVSDNAKTMTPVIVPQRSGSIPSDAEKEAARSLFAQLGSPDSGTIAVVGLSTGSGARRVGELLAGASAHHDAVQVLECLPLGTDPDLADHLSHADYVVVVAQQYLDRLPTLASTLSLLPDPSRGFIAITRHRWWPRKSDTRTDETTARPPAVVDGEQFQTATDATTSGVVSAPSASADSAVSQDHVTSDQSDIDPHEEGPHEEKVSPHADGDNNNDDDADPRDTSNGDGEGSNGAGVRTLRDRVRTEVAAADSI